MKRLVSVSLALLIAGVAAPAVGEPEKKTELVRLDGESVDLMLLRYEFGDVWVVDTQNVLWRDASRDYYLVSLANECAQLEHRRQFDFHPENPWRLKSSYSYEIRPQAGPACPVARIAEIDDEQADGLRATALRRVWR